MDEGGGRATAEAPTRFSQREFLIGLGAVAALGGIAYGVDDWVSGGPPWPEGEVSAYRSRPDLRPPPSRST